ncbi:MAG: FG-GAP and VCBS repeat-containing protein [Bryobacteraceae bacterium]
MRRCRVLLLFSSCLLVGVLPVTAQNVQVSSALPSQTTQGTVNLDVTVAGNGFKQGAQAQWFVSGSINPGGVTVNSTTFVSSSQLTANITVSTTATISSYDISVTNKNGSSGKGTGLFSVNAGNGNQNQACLLQPLPSAFTQMGTLNYVNSSGTAQYSGAFGLSVRVFPLTLGSKNVLVTVVGSGGSQLLDVFFVDPLTGSVLDGTAIGTNTSIQPHLTKSIATKPGNTVIGDFNGDGVPDFAAGHLGSAYAFLGSIDGATGVLSYSDAIPLVPPNANNDFASDIAAADLNGDGRDEIVVAAGAANSGSNPNQVFLFRFDPLTSTFGVYQTFNDPAPHSKSGFGRSVTVGDITGAANIDLIVGGSDAIYVYPGPDFTSSFTLPLKTLAAGTGNMDGGSFQDLLSAAQGGGSIFSGPVYSTESPAFTIAPVSGVAGIWPTGLAIGDVNHDGLADIVVGAPDNLATANCPAAGGSAYVFLTNPATPDQPVRYLLQPPRMGRGYGESAAVAPPPYNIFFVGENGGDVAPGDTAGQVWIYKVN